MVGGALGIGEKLLSGQNWQMSNLAVWSDYLVPKAGYLFRSILTEMENLRTSCIKSDFFTEPILVNNLIFSSCSSALRYSSLTVFKVS